MKRLHRAEPGPRLAPPCTPPRTPHRAVVRPDGAATASRHGIEGARRGRVLVVTPLLASLRASLRAPLLAPVLALVLGLAGCAGLPAPGGVPGAASPGAETARAVGAPAPAVVPADPGAGAASSSAEAPAPAPMAAGGADAASATAPDGTAASPRARLDPAQDAAAGDLWQRIRDGMAMPDLDNDAVRKWEQWYAARPDYVARMTERGSRYLFHIVEEVTRRGLPAELALLPFIESAFNPQALSHARASGMWQFMPATGKDFELRQNLFRDDRRDVLASTRAALDYLERLRGRFDDWHLALAAYNWGQGNVQRAVDRNLRARRSTDYGSLQGLPLETREYVPKLQAVKNIVLRPAAFGLALPPLQDRPFFTVVAIERDIDVALAARLAGLDLDDFHSLNPQHNKPVILAAGTPQVLLPYDNANRFVRGLDAHRGPLSSWTAWIAPRTLKVADAARLAGTEEDALREVNRIPPRMMVRAGSALLVPRAAHAHHVTHDVPGSVADSAALLLAPEGRALRRASLRAGPQGDSVAAVARRHRVSAQQVAQWNDMRPGDRFRPGQTIVVMLPARAGAEPPRARERAAPRPRAQAREARPSRPTQVAQAGPAARGGQAAVRRAQRPR